METIISARITFKKFIVTKYEQKLDKVLMENLGVTGQNLDK